MDSRPFVGLIGQKTPIAAIPLTLLPLGKQKKSRKFPCKIAKRPVVELFGPADVNSNRSYSGFRRKISTDESRALDLLLVWLWTRVYSPRQEREYGLFGPDSGRYSVEISQ